MARLFRIIVAILFDVFVAWFLLGEEGIDFASFAVGVAWCLLLMGTIAVVYLNNTLDNRTCTSGPYLKQDEESPREHFKT